MFNTKALSRSNSAPSPGASDPLSAASRGASGLARLERLARRGLERIASGKGFRNCAKAMLATSLCSLVAWVLFPALDLVNIALLYLLGCAWCGLFLGRLASVLGTFVSVLEFDFLFVPPRFSIEVYDWRYVVTFAIMTGISLLISELATRSRRQLALAEDRADRLRALYEFSRELASRQALGEVFSVLIEHARVEIGVDARIELSSGDARDAGLSPEQPNEGRVGEGEAEPGNCIPISVSGKVIAWLTIETAEKALVVTAEQRELLHSLVALASLAAERTVLADAAEQSKREVEQQEIRNLMLSSISHDLRTPMTAIIGSAQSLREQGDRLDRDTGRQLIEGIVVEAERMSGLLNNILEMSWLDSGAIAINRSWNDIDELVGVTVKSLAARLAGHPLRVAVAANMPLVECDAGLICQVIANLLENACKYTPPESAIQVEGTFGGGRICVGVLDSGPGLPAGAEEKVFEKFYQANPEGPDAGIGLGLAICRTILILHGGGISAENRVAGGAGFWFWLPLGPAPHFLREG